MVPQFVLAQTPITITIGDSSNWSDIYPFDNYYRGSWSQTIYSPSEVGQSGYITEVAYNCAYADTLTFADLRIYMGVTYDSTMEEDLYFLGGTQPSTLLIIDIHWLIQIVKQRWYQI